jgi:dsDNA-binding SOS-regulon protein
MIAMDIGKRFLPAANQVIGWANGMLVAFNAMPDRFQWAGDTLVAAFDVAIEHIKINFAQMVADMLAETVAMAREIGSIVADPSSFFSGLGVEAGAALQSRDTGGLEASQARLDALLNRFEAAQQATQAVWEGPRMPAAAAAAAQPAQPALTAAAGKSLWSIIMPAAENMLGSAMDTFASWWKQSTPSEAEAKQEPLQFASAMQRGSADAFRTILAAQGRKSPEAQATDHLTQVVQQQVGAPLQQIAINTMPQFAPEF